MQYFDVFNGDADGICALHQLRLSEPRESTLITGVKRDIQLLKRVDAQAGDHVTVLDISFDKNRDAVVDLLARGVAIHYVDHHFAGKIPEHPALSAIIDTAPNTCTSLLVNQALKGAHVAWAVVAAFGDNFYEAAAKAATPLDLDDHQLADLCKLGTCINYNGYGMSVDDLFFAPDDLYRSIRPYADPFDFMKNDSAWEQLREGYAGDMQLAKQTQAEFTEEGVALYILPDAMWARRIGGVFSNDLARANPECAHALLTRMNDGSYQVSVRAPLSTRRGADVLCRQFSTGGGREAAAGINHLPADKVELFIELFRKAFGKL